MAEHNRELPRNAAQGLGGRVNTDRYFKHRQLHFDAYGFAGDLVGAKTNYPA